MGHSGPPQRKELRAVNLIEKRRNAKYESKHQPFFPFPPSIRPVIQDPYFLPYSNPPPPGPSLFMPLSLSPTQTSNPNRVSKKKKSPQNHIISHSLFFPGVREGKWVSHENCEFVRFPPPPPKTRDAKLWEWGFGDGWVWVFVGGGRGLKKGIYGG